MRGIFFCQVEFVFVYFNLARARFTYSLVGYISTNFWNSD